MATSYRARGESALPRGRDCGRRAGWVSSCPVIRPTLHATRPIPSRSPWVAPGALLVLLLSAGSALGAPERSERAGWSEPPGRPGRVVLDGRLLPLDPPPMTWLLGAAGADRPLLDASTSPDDEVEVGQAVPRPVRPDAGGWTSADEVIYSVPRFRFELAARAMAVIDTQVKHGPEPAAHTIRLRRDLNVPYRVWPGYRALLEVKVQPRFAIGAQYTQVLLDGSRRSIHYRGVSLGRDTFGGDERVATEVGLQFAEGYVRYVIRDDARIRLSVGVGAAWASFRIRLDARRDGSGRVETFFAPTFNYMFSARLLQHFAIFIESTTAVVAPARFPSFASEVRAGFRFPFGASFELVLAGCLNSAQIEDAKDLWGGQVTSTHRWEQARWTSIGLDVGISVWF